MEHSIDKDHPNTRAILKRIRNKLFKKDATFAEPETPNRQKDELVDLDINDVLTSSKRLIAINRGDAEPDDRDSLAFKRVYTTGDLIAERINIDAEKTARTLLRKLNRKRSLKNLPSNIFNRYTEGHIVGNPLSSPLEETNPVQLLEQQYRITQMGPGGIGSESALTEEMQNVNPSEFGFIDPLTGPECYGAGEQVFTRRGWVKWEHVIDTDELLTLETIESLAEPFYEKPSRLIAEDYEGELFCWKTKDTSGRVTPNHTLFLRDTNTKPFKALAADVFTLNKSFELLMSRPGGVVKPAHCFKESYKNKVYCATVTSGILYVKGADAPFGYWCGNSGRAGIDVRATHNSRLGSDGRIYQRFFNPRLKRYEWLSARDLQGKTIGFPA